MHGRSPDIQCQARGSKTYCRTWKVSNSNVLCTLSGKSSSPLVRATALRSTLRFIAHQRREDVHRKINTKEERSNAKVLKSSFQFERLQKILMDGEQQCTLYSVRQEFKSFGVTPPPLYSAAFELKMPVVPMVPMTLEDPIVSLTTTSCQHRY